MIDIQTMVESEINSLWKKHSDLELCEYPANCTRKIPESGIVFIGLNPSLSVQEIERLKRDNIKDCEFPQLKDSPTDEHRYFRKFFVIAEQTQMNWGHLDILYCRKTSQKDIEELLKSKHEGERDFLNNQLEITKLILEKVINESNPRIFVVANSLARKLLGSIRCENGHSAGINLDFKWDEELGTYTYKNNPFFFSSMLTGQRALDNGSFERLVWHIKKVKSKLEKSNS